VDASVFESGTGTGQSADKGCTDTGSADKWDEGAAPLDGSEPCKGADPSKGNESCGVDPSGNDDEYCEGVVPVVPPGGVPRRLSDPVVTSSAAATTTS
jgi:hypothetical protein